MGAHSGPDQEPTHGAQPHRLGALAERVGGRVNGDPEIAVRRVRTLELAGPDDLSFVAHGVAVDRAAQSRAGALLVASDLEEPLRETHSLLIVEAPKLALAQVLEVLYPRRRPAPGVHSTAVIGEGTSVDPRASIGPYVVIESGCVIGAAVLHPHVVVGPDCRIGDDTEIFPHVTLYARTWLGDRVIVHAGVVLGADGFGYEPSGGEHVKIPQVGRTVVEDDVEIGALSAIDRALLEETRIGRGSKIDNLVQVGHNVTLGRGCILCGQAGIAGSSQLGDYVILAGQAGAGGHLKLGDGVQVAAKSAVLQSVAPGRKVGGIPAVDLASWRRQALMLPRLGELARRLRSLEKKLEDGGEAARESFGPGEGPG